MHCTVVLVEEGGSKEHSKPRNGLGGCLGTQAAVRREDDLADKRSKYAVMVSVERSSVRICGR